MRIPRVPARFKDQEGYTAEMRRAGFSLERFEVLDTYMGCRSMPVRSPSLRSVTGIALF